MNLSLLAATVYLVSIISLIIFYSYRSIFNIPLVIAILDCMIIGPLHGEIFCGGLSEKRNYFLAPWSFDSIIFTKTLILVVVLCLVPLPLMVITEFFFDNSLNDYIHSGLYLFTSAPVFINFGTISSVWQLGKEEDTSGNIILQFFMFLFSLVPYLVLQIWLESIVLCLLFMAFSIFFWYKYTLKFASGKFHEKEY